MGRGTNLHPNERKAPEPQFEKVRKEGRKGGRKENVHSLTPGDDVDSERDTLNLTNFFTPRFGLFNAANTFDGAMPRAREEIRAKVAEDLIKRRGKSYR